MSSAASISGIGDGGRERGRPGSGFPSVDSGSSPKKPTEGAVTHEKTSEAAMTSQINKEADNGEKNLGGDVLSVIGKRLAEERVLAPPMYADFVIRWTDILNMGLPIEERDSLSKKYPPPLNCTFLDPPKLNAEVERAITDVARIRDKRILLKYEKLTACVSGIAKTITTLLDRETVTDIPIIESLSDICRLLIDAMHDESAIRRSLILAYVNTSMKSTLNTTVVNEWLFGKNLAEDLKTGKLIDQSAEELKAKKQSQSGPKNYKGPSRHSHRNHSGQSSGPKYPSNTAPKRDHRSQRADQHQRPQHYEYKSSSRGRRPKRR